MSGLIATLGMGLMTITSLTAAPRWSNDYGASLRKATTEGRPLLVVLATPRATASQAVEQSPGIRAASFRTTTPTPGEELLQHYVLCRVDVTTEYGSRVASAFRATQFPHTVVIDRTGSKQLYKRSGNFSNEEWVTMLASYRQGTSPQPPAPPPTAVQPAASFYSPPQSFSSDFGGMLGFPSSFGSSSGTCFT